jgi:hypothetical protein
MSKRASSESSRLTLRLPNSKTCLRLLRFLVRVQFREGSTRRGCFWTLNGNRTAKFSINDVYILTTAYEEDSWKQLIKQVINSAISDNYGASLF